MVSLYTNRPAYANDIAEVVRAYLGFAEIALRENAMGDFPQAAIEHADYAFNVIIDDEIGEVVAQAYCAGLKQPATGSFSFDRNEQSPLLRKKYEKRALKVAVFRAMRMLRPDIVLPWGALTGIRPTKLLRELVETMGEEAAADLFVHEFHVREEKAALAKSIIDVQQALFKSIQEKDVDVYVGIPYCRTRCLYCSFASEVLPKSGVPKVYMDALFEDIRMGAELARACGLTVRSMYIGGGTPTVLTAEELQTLLAHLERCYGGFGRELTLEAGRPDTLDMEKLQVIKKMGVQRISLNPQSMQEKTLQRIGRNHTPEEIVAAYHAARDVGFDNINMDIIVGLPGETIADISNTLEQIQALNPESFTVHTLAVKRSSRLKEKLEEYRLPEAEEAEAMAEAAGRAAQELGMHPYYMYRQKYMRGNLENIGYAKAGKDCIYNVDMMEEMVSILSHGAGSMTKRVFPGRNMRVERIPSPKDIQTYIGKLETLNKAKQALFVEGGQSEAHT
ncbi:coproporphyrinogen dehydrogenase HemZ [Christensenellaceae bacterium OttesenSCG-928-L17]|nr:coproporphyrinogen dehydrogenase HemZ [Christensenellaceae bacterium OttesenSCG-928-L17]